MQIKEKLQEISDLLDEEYEILVGMNQFLRDWERRSNEELDRLQEGMDRIIEVVKTYYPVSDEKSVI